MNQFDIEKIADSAQMIVGGYAFSQTEEEFIRVLNLHAPHHALVMTEDAEILETNMDDIEISIVCKLWNRNKKFLKEAYA